VQQLSVWGVEQLVLTSNADREQLLWEFCRGLIMVHNCALNRLVWKFSFWLAAVGSTIYPAIAGARQLHAPSQLFPYTQVMANVSAGSSIHNAKNEGDLNKLCWGILHDSVVKTESSWVI